MQVTDQLKHDLHVLGCAFAFWLKPMDFHRELSIGNYLRMYHVEVWTQGETLAGLVDPVIHLIHAH